MDVMQAFASLAPGNLLYVTGSRGRSILRPQRVAVLEHAQHPDAGQRILVKVVADDVLELNGARLAEDFMPALEG